MEEMDFLEAGEIFIPCVRESMGYVIGCLCVKCVCMCVCVCIKSSTDKTPVTRYIL